MYLFDRRFGGFRFDFSSWEGNGSMVDDNVIADISNIEVNVDGLSLNASDGFQSPLPKSPFLMTWTTRSLRKTSIRFLDT